ncbi:MAG: hypothetical protein WAX41_05655 [Lactobacillus delbrueckii]
MSWYRYQLVSSFIVYAVGGIGMYRALCRFVCLAYPLILLGMGMSAEIMLKEVQALVLAGLRPDRPVSGHQR